MIYTIGHRESYLRGFAELGLEFKKLGVAMHQGKPYKGGAVFETPGHAFLFLKQKGLLSTYTAFGVYADWTADTVFIVGESHRRLLKTSRLAML